MDKVIESAKAAVLPFESWERLPGESSAAFAAFCCYRDYGAERNIRKAVLASCDGGGEAVAAKKYKTWRQWSMRFQWVKRAEDYDLYIDRLKQAEKRKTIEAQGEVHRMITGKMLQVVNKKLDLMDAGELTQGNLTEWVETAIKADREAAGLVTGNDGKPDGWKQGEIKFTPEFDGL